MGSTEHSETTIFYEFTFDDGTNWQHEVSLSDEAPRQESTALQQESRAPQDESRAPQQESKAPQWTRLEFQQCSHCPLTVREAFHCPYAAALAGPVLGVGQRASFETVDVRVLHRGREIRQRTTLQRALGSLLGLLGAVSGCPHTRMLRPMARFHWPFSSSQETLFRALGSYLLGQHLKAQKGLDTDWSMDGLRDIYRNLRLVNQGMSNRLRMATKEDSAPNSVVLLDLLAADMEYLLESYEGELDQFFPEFFE